jgi:hypothetical protein
LASIRKTTSSKGIYFKVTLQQLYFEGETYFKPLFKKIIQSAEFSMIFENQYKKLNDKKRRMFFLPQGILYQSLK